MHAPRDDYTEADYVADHYGVCKREGFCECQRIGRWVGRACGDWVPVAASSLEEMRLTLRKGRA